MDENLQEQEQTPTEGEPNALDAAIAKLRAAAGSGFDPDQMAKLKEKLANLHTSDARTHSGSEDPDAKQDAARAEGQPLTGRDVDWSEYNLDFNVAHLYPQAVFRETPQGPAWVTKITDFVSTSKDFRSHGKKVNAPDSSDGKITEWQNIGEYLKDMINGREQWKIAAVMPCGSQCGILLEREVPIILPHPVKLQKSEEVAPPSDPALQQVEDAALAFAAETTGQKLTVDTEGDLGEDTSAPQTVGVRPIERGSEEHEQVLASLDETGAIPARSGELVLRALDVAASNPDAVPAPTAGFVQPEAVEGNDFARTPANPEGKVAAAGVSAAQDLLRALNDPNFRAALPKEE